MNGFTLFFLLLLLLVLLGGWLLGQRFWQRSKVLAASGWARCRAGIELLLLASAWNLLIYCFTAILMLPWAKGLSQSTYSASPYEWEEAHWRHELCLLLLSGVGGALTLVVCRRRVAALSWLLGCVLVLAGFRGQRFYHDQSEVPQVATNIYLGLPKVYAHYCLRE